MIILWKLFLQYLFNVYLEGTARVAAILPDLKIDLAVFCATFCTLRTECHAEM
jgi:hypothetical protein